MKFFWTKKERNGHLNILMTNRLKMLAGKTQTWKWIWWIWSHVKLPSICDSPIWVTLGQSRSYLAHLAFISGDKVTSRWLKSYSNWWVMKRRKILMWPNSLYSLPCGHMLWCLLGDLQHSWNYLIYLAFISGDKVTARLLKSYSNWQVIKWRQFLVWPNS
jgi:hypothetical protein